MLLNFFQEHRCVFLRNFIVCVNIGVYECEKQAAQRMRFNIKAYIPLNLSTPKNDLLDEVFNYETLIEAVQQQCKRTHVQLQETICDQLADNLLADQRLSAVSIRCEKLDVNPNWESVGVEIFRMQSQKDILS